MPLIDLVYLEHFSSFKTHTHTLETSQTFKLGRRLIGANSGHVKLLSDGLSEHPFESLQRGLALCGQV